MNEIDMLKGFAAINVAIGHLAFLADAHLLYYRWIFQWHMIAFFFISGFVFSDQACNQPFYKFIYKRFKQLIIPALFFRIFQAAIDTGVFHNIGKFDIFINNVPSYLYHYSVEWFTPSLFIASILLYIFAKARSKLGKKVELYALILIVFTPFLCKLYDNKIGRDTLFLPFLPDSTLLGSGFVFLGYIFRKRFNNSFDSFDQLWEKTKKYKVTMLICGIGITLLWILYAIRQEYGYVNIASGKLGDSEILFYFFGIFWVFILLVLFCVLYRNKRASFINKYLIFVGHHSLGFYLLHIAANNVWKIIYLNSTGNEWQYWAYSIPIRLLYGAVILLIVSIIIWISQSAKNVVNPPVLDSK